MSMKIVLAALVYMCVSVSIVFSNKLVLTTFKFPSYLLLALLQTLFSFVLTQALCSSRIRSNDLEIPIKILPLSIFSALDIVMGIASTGSLSLPLFTALRRISNLFIMVGEYFLLGTKRSNSIHLSVIVMVIGAGIAAIGDITFDPVGYTYIFINNISTTGKALLTKSRLTDYNFSSIELIYFNSLLMLPILSILVYIKCEPSEITQFEFWLDPVFLLYFLFSCCSAVALNYSVVQCTQYTSALTTSILGVIKNILVTYGGMFVGGDYVYTTLNFVGLTISTVGAILYVLYNYKSTQPKSQPT
uniref:UDP-glucuronic acid/UDP-N-acetylgalactosamine transporter n=1 Tax=Schistosoma japonicum TaxID=6182 RepID=C1LKA4_SCHJA|nr:UDP-glucuronic acid/UDP-N-acetylgalactosamine transporter [Schistosoma japonicum]